MSYRSKIINDIADALGEDVAVKVQKHYAGRLLYISNKAGSNLVFTLGKDTAQKLYDAFGADTLRIPLGDKNLFAIKKRQFFAELNNGTSVLKAQAKCGISERCAWNWKKDYDTNAGDVGSETSLPLF